MSPPRRPLPPGVERLAAAIERARAILAASAVLIVKVSRANAEAAVLIEQTHANLRETEALSAAARPPAGRLRRPDVLTARPTAPPPSASTAPVRPRAWSRRRR